LATDEGALIDTAKSDPAAFEALYRSHVDRIYNYIYHRVGNAEDAEDLTARTFQQALVNLPAYDDRGAPFSAWLYRIGHNLIANWHRDQGRRRTVSLDGLDGAAEPQAGESLAERTFTREEVQGALRRLDPDRQALLILKFSEGLSNAEIGAFLGRSEGAVKSLYHRTLLALRDSLASDGTTSERK
jgi:RNA polymerase sigma-70 factor (ECF subfamily)